MINPKDVLQYKNVVSKRFKVPLSDLGATFQEFKQDIQLAGGTLTPSFFYALENMPTDETLEVELFQVVEEWHMSLSNDYKFYSYFSIENLISLNMIGHYEQSTELAYVILKMYIEKNNLKQATPIYHVIHGDKQFNFVTMKIGVAKQSNESVWK